MFFHGGWWHLKGFFRFKGATWKFEDFVAYCSLFVLASTFYVDVAFGYSFDEDIACVVHFDFDTLKITFVGYCNAL